MSGPEERRRAVEPYFTTPMTTAQVVEHLGYPIRQCLERWLAKNPRHAGHMAKPIISLETRTKAIEPVPDGMRGSGPPNDSARASELSTTGSRRIVRAVWPRCGPKTGTPARPTSLRRDEAGIPGPSAMTWRRCAAGSRSRNLENAVMREAVEARRKRPGRRPAAPVEQGEDASGRPSAPDVFAQPDDMLARHRTEQPPTVTTPSSPAGCSSRLRRRCRRERIPWCIPTTAATAGGPDRYGLARSTGAKGCSPDNTAAEGFFGRMRTESVHPGHWEERTSDEVLVPVDEYLRWYNHEPIKRSLGWMSSVQYRQSQGMAA